MQKLTRARKVYKCSDCGCVIWAGELYERVKYPIIRGGSPEYTPDDFYCKDCSDRTHRRPVEPVTYGTYCFDWLESFLQLTWSESRPGATYSNALPAESYELTLFGVIWI